MITGSIILFGLIVIGVPLLLTSCGNPDDANNSSNEKPNEPKSPKENTDDFLDGAQESTENQKEDEPPVEFAEVTCTSARDEEDILYVCATEDNLIELANISQLMENNIDMTSNSAFQFCKYFETECPGAEIEGNEWKEPSSSSGQGTNGKNLEESLSYMICTKGFGAIFFVNSGQEPEDFADAIKDMLRNSIPLIYQKYFDNTDILLSQISGIDPNKVFGWDLDNFKKIYESNKSTYSDISDKTGVPPELVAALHYRESGCDFDTYLHNGQPLGTPTTIVPKGRLFYDFSDAAIDALESKQKSMGFDLSPGSDMVTMMTFAEAYNGTGYTDYRNIPTPYVYSGTNVYSTGKYTSDGNFNAQAVDKQPGVYILVKSIMDE